MGKKEDDDAFDNFFGDDGPTPTVDTRAEGRLLRIPVARLAATPVNPRKDFGSEDDLIDLGKSLARRQNQACPVVSRSAYLKLWPEHADLVGRVDYVLVSGERRYRAATAVRLPALNCVVDDGAAASRKVFMEAVVSENVDRQNFDAIEEAYAVQALVAEFGTNRAVAQHFERADGWVTQRVLLTHLAPDVQHLVRKKTMPLEVARRLGKLARDGQWDAGQQLEWWDKEKGLRVAAKRPAQAPAAAPAVPARRGEGDPSFTAVKHPASLTPVPGPSPAPAPAPPEGSAEVHQSSPAPETTGPPEAVVVPVPPPAGETSPEKLHPAPEPAPEPNPHEVTVSWVVGDISALTDDLINRLTPEERWQITWGLMPWSDEKAVGDMLERKLTTQQRRALVERFALDKV